MTTELHLEQSYSAASLAVLRTFRAAVDTIAAEHNLDNAATAKKLLARFIEHLGGEDAPAGEMDGRTAKWRCRFRIYDPNRGDEVIADSDDDLPPDRPGSMVISGLPSVAAEVRALAQAFHPGKPLMGLSREETERRLKGLRPTLSRRGGAAAWRLPYETVESFAGNVSNRRWLMRVDIVREQETGK